MLRKNKSEKETIGERIKRIRKQKGYTQTNIGEKVGIIQKLVSDYENGRLRISIDLLILFAKALEVNVNELVVEDSSIKKEVSPISSKLAQRMRRIETLPVTQQKTLVKTIDAFLKAEGK